MSYKHEEEYKLALEEMKQDPGCTYKYLAAKYHFDYRCFKTYLKRQGIVNDFYNLLTYLYKDANLYLTRKYNIYLERRHAHSDSTLQKN